MPQTIKERGATDILLIAITLPIIFLLFAVVVDIAREPIALTRLSDSLEIGASASQSELEDNGLLSDSLNPAMNVLCSTSSCLQRPNAETFVGTDATQKRLSQAFCSMASRRISGLGSYANPLTSSSLFGSMVYSVGFGWLRYRVNTQTIEVVSQSLSSEACGEGGKGWRSYGSSELDGRDFASDIGIIRHNLNSRLQTSPSNFSAAWRVEGEHNNYLDSFWLVGIGKLKVKHIFGFFNTNGSSNIRKAYFIRPMRVPLGVVN